MVNVVIYFSFQSLGQMNPKLNVMMEGALENMKHWSELKIKSTEDPQPSDANIVEHEHAPELNGVENDQVAELNGVEHEQAAEPNGVEHESPA